jgi:hypothetical protein
MGRDRGQLVTVGRDDDGQSSVLGVVLMMGFVAAAAVAVFVVGTATVGETKNTAQEQQVENTFKQFNKDVSSVAYGRQKYRSMEFDIEDQTAALRQEDTGTIEVNVEGNSTNWTVSVGSLVYENNGETIAYQAGGVWRGTGKDSRMVSRPPVEYQTGSLTFPISVLDGDDQVRAGKLDLNKKSTTKNESLGYVEGKLVTLNITSEYYMGWAEYFRTQTNDVAVSVNHSPPGDTGTVTVKLGRRAANGDFSDAVFATGGDKGDIYVDNNKESPEELAATGSIDNKKGSIPGEEDVESSLYVLDPAIERKVKNAKDVVADPSDTSIKPIDVESVSTSVNDEITAGTYYDEDGFSLNDDVTFDVSSGNITLIVDDDIEVEGDMDVIGTSSGKSVRIYSTGYFGMSNARAGASKSAGAKHFQVYGTSDMLVALTGGSNTQFVGTIYAPRNEPVLSSGEENDAVVKGGGSHCEGWDMCIATGSSGFTGAIVGGPTYMGQATTVEYDSDLKDVKPTLQLDDGVLPPPITFLKVSVHTVAVNNSGASNIRPAGGFGASASVTAPAAPSTAGFASTAGTASAVVAPTARGANPLQ